MANPPLILIIDDNRSLVNMIAGVLHKRDYEVITAFDGLEGLLKAQDEKPDLIVLDIVMPKLDGYEVCHRLQENPATKHIPVIMLTVKGQVDDPTLDERTIEGRIQEQMAGFEVGAVDFLTKPVKAGELIERIKSLLYFEKP
ncbi:MAG TPA: response regulator [Anaerolineae bacterium]